MSWRIVSVSSMCKLDYKMDYGLKSLLSEEELSSFYRSIFYEKLDLLLIEARQQTPPGEEEITTIIDRDLCVLQDA